MRVRLREPFRNPIDELARHGCDVSPGTLYPILHALEEDDLLALDERIVEGRRRKYYTITPSGQAALAEAKEKIQELVDEVLYEQGPDTIHPPEETHGE